MLAPEGSVGRIDGIEVVSDRGERYRTLKTLVDSVDVVVGPGLEPRSTVLLARRGIKTIYDVYVPLLLERLAYVAGEDLPDRQRVLGHRTSALLQELAAAAGDAILCANERQRDLWFGVLGALGRIAPGDYAVDPALRHLVGVVPFGLDPAVPKKTRNVVKGVVPGVEATDRVLLWVGGMWNWLDPLTPIRAMKTISATRHDVKLYFIGVDPPSGVRRMAMAEKAMALARELDLLDRSVFFRPGWVSYDERHEYLLEADVGASAHPDSVESRLAYRTRLLDYLWAGLPIVATEGDVLSDVVVARNLGRAVPPNDNGAWARAILELLDARALDACATNIAAVRGEFTWAKALQPLEELVESPLRRPVELGALVPILRRYYAARAALAVAERDGRLPLRTGRRGPAPASL